MCQTSFVPVLTLWGFPEGSKRDQLFFGRKHAIRSILVFCIWLSASCFSTILNQKINQYSNRWRFRNWCSHVKQFYQVAHWQQSSWACEKSRRQVRMPACFFPRCSRARMQSMACYTMILALSVVRTCKKVCQVWADWPTADSAFNLWRLWCYNIQTKRQALQSVNQSEMKMVSSSSPSLRSTARILYYTFFKAWTSRSWTWND